MKRIFIDEIGGTNAIRIVFDYDKSLVRHTKRLSDLGITRRYRKTPFKHWWVPISQFNAEKVIEHFEDQDFEIDQEVYELAEEDDIDVTAKRHPLDHELLRDYQVEAVNFIDATGGRCLIADEMGLGKTVEALSWVRRHEDELERVAVICPANVTYKWRDEICRWVDLPPRAVGILEGFNSEWPEDRPFIISSYTTMAERYDEFVRWVPDTIIADECHYLKNYKAKRTKAMKHLNAVADYFIAMSGTPFLNRPMEMFNVLNMINSADWKSAYEFGNRYAGGEFGIIEGRGQSKGKFRGRTNVEELRERLDQYMIRRLKADVLDELPNKTRSLVPLDIPNRSEYNDALNADYDNILVKIGELWRIVGRGKAEAATSWVKDFFSSSSDNSKLVIKCRHIEPVMHLKEALSDYKPLTIAGDVEGQVRKRRIDLYQNPSEHRIIILTDAGSEGIDLFGIGGVDSSNILFVERSWSPAREEQAEDRLHRMGQVSAVEAHYLVARHTMDVTMNRVIQEKREGIRDVVGLHDPDTTIKKLVAKEALNE